MDSSPRFSIEQLWDAAENVDVWSAGSFESLCPFCGALFFELERTRKGNYNKCCQGGEVQLEPIPHPSALVLDLLMGTHPRASQFKKSILYYNNAFAMSSIGAGRDDIIGHGPHIVKMNGLVMHRTSWIHPRPGEKRKYGQLYVLDPINAVKRRCLLNNQLDSDLVTALETDFRQHNPFVRSFTSLKDLVESERSRGIPLKDIRMEMVEDKSVDLRRFNLPTGDEIAVVFRARDGAPGPRDVVVYPNEGQPISISNLSRFCDPLAYPIFFSTGGFGWKLGTNLILDESSLRKNRKLTMLKYYACRLHVRAAASNSNFVLSNILLSGRTLTQLFFIDAYMRSLDNRLRYIRENQTKLMAAKYNALKLFISRNCDLGLRPGTQVILPSGFVGSPRYLYQCYLDAMAMVAKYGKPDLFITMTCNQNWDEIIQALPAGMTPSDRPDIVTRVFAIKLHALLTDIIAKKHFGEVVGWTYVIEFQKRGLPHAHMLFVLKDTYKIRTKDDVDKFVSAELPDPRVHPKLYDAVKNFSFHTCKVGRCKDSPDGPCSRNFPKSFQEETDVMTDSYPHYRRRQNYPTSDSTFEDNRFVVPYNPFLLMKYKCHLNVEICASVKSIKYIYKYIFKGYDAALLRFLDQVSGEVHIDEIKAYQETRYISATEAAWRLFEFPVDKMSHTVVRLSVHEKNEQLVFYDPETVSPDVINNSSSHLLGFFALNRSDSRANSLTFLEVPLHYIWSKGRWIPRKKRIPLIVRIHQVPPTERERFALRLLLLHRRNVKSWDDLLLSPQNAKNATFVDAARSWGLIDDCNEWVLCLREAAQFQMPSALRMLFANICCIAPLANHLALWNTFREYLIEDFHDYNPEEAAQLALYEIRRIVESCTASSIFLNLGLPLIMNYRFSNHALDSNNVLDHRQSYIISNRNRSLLNTAQAIAYRTVISASLDPNLPRFFYVDGPGGSGKTFLYNTLLHHFNSQKKPFLAVSWTGVAAMLLLDGQTSHHAFRLPINIDDCTQLKVERGTALWKKLASVELIVWDEITLVSSYALNAVDRLLRLITNTDSPFGNKLVVVGGDFRQCLPVFPHAHRSAIVERTVKNADAWASVQKLSLSRNMRLDQGEFHSDFSQWLLDIGDGRAWPKVDFPPNMIVSEEVLIDEVFGEAIQYEDLRQVASSAILCPRNEDTHRINDMITNLRVGELKQYLSTDEVYEGSFSDISQYPTEFLNSLCPSGFPPHRLNLKVGAPIILLRNLDLKNKLTNGTRLILTRLSNHTLTARVIIDNAVTNQTVFIPRIDFISSETDIPIRFRRRQFPIRCAYAMTINKAQGQTLNRVGLLLSTECFAHGQLYVGLSRVRNPSNLRICITQQASTSTANIVYPEVFD